MALKKKPLPAKTLTVKPGGSLEGHELVMRPVSGRVWIAVKRGTLSGADLLHEMIQSIEDSTFRDEDLDLLGLDELNLIEAAWFKAHVDRALPPETGSD